MKTIKRISIIIIMLSLLLLCACKNNDYLKYKVEDNYLIVIIDDIEYNIGVIEYDSDDLKIKDAYEFYKKIYPSYIGTKEEFEKDVINNRLDEGDAVLTVIYNIDGVKKELLFYRGDNLNFPNIPKDYFLKEWLYNGNKIDENYIVTDDMEIDAVLEKYVNINIDIIGNGSARLDKNKAVKGDTIKIISNPDFGYKLASASYNGENIDLSNDNSFKVKDDNDINIEVVFEVEALSMPIMNIELDTELENVDKIDYVNAKMSISNTDEKYEFSDLDFLFRGRGNWSWAKEKKGYRIKFDSKQNLFGNCKSKHWAIIASYTDITLNRNKVSFEMAEVFDDIYYVTSCVNLEVFINGEYRGVYSLIELPKAEKDKMNIDESYEYVDTGYIIELDAYAITDWQHKPTNAVEGIDYFKIDGVKYPFSVKSPDPDDLEDEEMFRKQVEFISNYFKEMFTAVFNHDFEEFEKYADVNSFVDMYLLDEIIKSTDVGWQSFYFVKEKEGKVYLTAPWDLEFSCGLNRGNQSYSGMYVSEWFDKNLDTKTASELFINLMEIDEFKTLAANRLKEVKDKLIESINKTLDDALLYEDSYNRNYDKFKILGTKLNVEGAEIYKLKTWKEHVEYLRSWLINRINWLDNYFKEEVNMKLLIDGKEVKVKWEDNESVKALNKILPLEINMEEYGGFEQTGKIGQSITRNDSNINVVPGDIVLYNGNQISIFYNNSSWSYTKLGHIDLSNEELNNLLNKDSVTIRFE